MLGERFWSKVDKREDGCWVWIAGTFPTGYGRFFVGGVRRRAHRIAYEALVGPVPDGLELDHLCRVRNCVNPAHLEPVTHAENMRRGCQATATHCLRGHKFTKANTIYRADRPGQRECRACARERGRRWEQQKRERQAS